MIGQTIDRFRVVEQLGQGGMGVVYKARDSTLDRFVALKVLPPDKNSDPDRRRRFLHEAKSASALNHPGIVAVYDVLEHEGRDVLVMELVDGETLETLISRKRLPLGEALGHAVGIADALARAHAAGIVHRDLKPSNVMVTADGVKVLDFGLAKLVDSPFPDPEAPTVAADESAMTRERVVMGTVGWMSPEQASGEPVDARSDVFAFGVILYEMLTGQHPFRRGSTIETMAAIRSEDPEPPTQLVPSLPPEAERATLRCLQKDPTRRWQSLSDLGAVLADLKQDTESGRRVVAEPVPRRRSIIPAIFGIAVAVALAAIVAALVILRPREAARAPLDLERLTYDAGISALPTISPDGNLVAFVSDRGGENNLDIWVRHINQPEPTRLTEHPADDWHPRFSPDGSRLVFYSMRDGGGLYIMNALGGGLRKVAGPGLFPRFSPDGSSIVFADHPMWFRSGLLKMFTVPANGGTRTPMLPGWGIYRPPSSSGPVFSPDGRLVIFPGAPFDDPGQRDWWVAPADGGEPWSSGVNDSIPKRDVVQFPAVWLPGRLIFLEGTTIEGLNVYSARISDDGKISGPVAALTSGPGMSWTPSVSKDGRIALSRFNWIVHLWQVGLDPATGRTIGEPVRITDDAAPKFSFSITKDGNRLAWSAYAGTQGARRGEVVVADRVTGEQSTPVTLTDRQAATSTHPHLSSDGTMLSWMSRDGGEWVAWVAPVDDPVGRELCRGCWVVDFFADGREVLLGRGRRQLLRIDLADGSETSVLELGEGVLLGVDLSRDNQWLAIKIGEPDGSVALHVVSMAEAAGPRENWIPVTDNSTYVGEPRWSVNGDIIYFHAEYDDFLCIWALALDPESKAPIGEPFPVVHLHDSRVKSMPLSRFMWTIEAGADRLVFNAGELSGDVYTAMLDSD
jgi:Tol biopolymer transport system component/predicted Ser/Thr protein kinase